MDKITQWSDLTVASLKTMGEKTLSTLPNILGAIVILIVGWIITKIAVYLLKKVLKLARVEKLTAKINEQKILGDSKIKFNITNVVVVFAKWILFLAFLIAAADVMNWEILSREISNLLGYLPKLLSAIAIFMVGMYIAKFVRTAIDGFYNSFDLAGGKIISNLAFYIIAIIISITALNQAGIDTTVITNNVTIILGAFLLAIAIGFGLGAKKLIGDILLTFYTRRNYEVGDKVNIAGREGVVKAIDNISMILENEKGKIIIPIKEVSESQAEVLK
ncbi:hypothetical protein MTsPCn5_38110 [Croceitalea sp. MTPC5]|uniref:mechanosensitive ion channel family protein n=1 Tax=Croceitalea sp. MTPC5 TaxID=3056565 RepID=UPI002B38D0F9|nr:hypothetical protein MTsPCn5_38110 [Croceitalea sp. MTPC5]